MFLCLVNYIQQRGTVVVLISNMKNSKIADKIPGHALMNVLLILKLKSKYLVLRSRPESYLFTYTTTNVVQEIIKQTSIQVQIL